MTTDNNNQQAYRREFLRFLAASPLLGSWSAFAQEVEQVLGRPIREADDVMNVFEMATLARENIPPAHYGYLMSGSDSDETVIANRAGFSRYQIRPRKLVDVQEFDMRVNVLGAESSSPVFLCPIGSAGAFHRDSDTGVARAAAAKNTFMMVSTQASTPLREIVDARGGPVWFQLYSTSRPDYAAELVRQAETAGATAIALTVDTPAGRNHETSQIWAAQDTRFCEDCHYPGQSKPAFDDFDMSGVGLVDASLTWDVVKQLKDVTDLPVLVKGIEAGFDADRAVRSGADGIILSNHGGRATPTGRGTVECLPEVVAAVRGRVPVILDGGVRRGSDVFKALALGASAVGIGRPYCWGLGAFGQAGVERVIDMINREFAIAMRGSGLSRIADINSDYIVDTGAPQQHLLIDGQMI